MFLGPWRSGKTRALVESGEGIERRTAVQALDGTQLEWNPVKELKVECLFVADVQQCSRWNPVKELKVNC